jgi:hypothetical protein
MIATIELAENHRHGKLLHAMFAIHDRFTHDEDIITFRRDDGATFRINFAHGHVSFFRQGATEKLERFWTESISIGKMDELLELFIWNQDDELRRYRWLVRPVKPRKRRET